MSAVVRLSIIKDQGSAEARLCTVRQAKVGHISAVSSLRSRRGRECVRTSRHDYQLAKH